MPLMNGLDTTSPPYKRNSLDPNEVQWMFSLSKDAPIKLDVVHGFNVRPTHFESQHEVHELVILFCVLREIEKFSRHYGYKNTIIILYSSLR